MTFFYDLNKRLADIGAKQQVNEDSQMKQKQAKDEYLSEPLVIVPKSPPTTPAPTSTTSKSPPTTPKSPPTTPAPTSTPESRLREKYDIQDQIRALRRGSQMKKKQAKDEYLSEPLVIVPKSPPTTPAPTSTTSKSPPTTPAPTNTGSVKEQGSHRGLFQQTADRLKGMVKGTSPQTDTGAQNPPASAAISKVREARRPQELDYQQGPEDDAEYRRHHSLDDPDRRRERKLRATDYKTLDRLERQAVNRAKQIDEEPNEGNEFAGELAKARASGAKQFKVDGKTYPVKGGEMDEGRNDPSPLDDPITRFRKRHAPSVMKDPKGREELSKLDTEYGERRKTAYGRGEEEDEGEEDGTKKDKPAGEKRGRGRPKGTRRAIGAKGPTGRSKLLRMAEGDADQQLQRIKFRGTDHDIGEERYRFAIGDNPMVFNFSSDEDNPDPDSPGFEEILAKVQRDGTVEHFKVTPAEQRAMAKKIAAERQKYLDQRKQGVSEDYDRDEYDEEGEMAQSQARTIEDAAQELQAILDADENLPEWVQKKITLAMDYIDTARDYLAANRPEPEMEESALQAHIGKKKYGDSGMKALQQAGREGASKDKMARIRAQHDKLDEVDLEEKAVSKVQRRAAGIAHAARKGDIPRSELRGASKEMAKMAGGELKKFAKTKEKGLPAKKTEEVEETTTAGNVATGGDAPAKGSKKGGMQFGKGIYDSMNRELEAMIAESMNVSVNMNSEGANGATKSVTVTATDEDADMLASLLTRSGLGGGMQSDSACPTCGSSPCDCAKQVDENEPDYPTDPVVSDDALQYAGGLNKPKSTGQTTTPIIAGQDEREVAYDDDGDALRRMREMAGIQEEKKSKPDFPDIDKDGNRKENISQAAKDKAAQEEKVDESVERGLWSLWQRIQ